MGIDRSLALSTASGIADLLCRAAFFHNGRCNWCGSVLEGGEESGIRTSYQTLGPDLYGGTSGIALFLGESFLRVGDARFLTTAEAAISGAIDRVDTIYRGSRFGFYTGTLGVAYAAVQLGHVLGRPDLISRARNIMTRLIADLDPPFLLDVIGGTAGAIPVLLKLEVALEMPELRHCAQQFGEAIMAAASKGTKGWSWGEKAGGIESPRDLTGFAHGAAGIGWSLLELYRTTSQAEFLDGALEAFRYENRWFQPSRDNWPDFRWDDGVEEPAPCMVAWCHGAVGIGLARLAALSVGDEPWVRRDAEAAVRASKQVLTDPDVPPDLDFCLCHGQSGTAAFLLRAGEVLHDEEARDLALTAAASSAARFAEAPHAWPVGLRRGTTPSLMTGLAGIGYFYLGLADPSLPSVLLFQS